METLEASTLEIVLRTENCTNQCVWIVNCFKTKALQLQVVDDVTTDLCLGAIKIIKILRENQRVRQRKYIARRSQNLGNIDEQLGSK